MIADYRSQTFLQKYSYTRMKNYVVIGASSGIGLAIADHFREQGHQVTGTYLTGDQLSDTGNLHRVNVLDESIDFGFLPDVIDGLVYCPGSINLKPFHRIKPQQFVDDFQLQVVGAIKVIQAALPALKKSTHPAIVLFSTVAVQTGFNFHTQVAASKGAIEGLVRSLAAELAPTIRVNGIAPSLTDTPLAAKLLSTDEKKEANAKRHPLQAIGTPETIAHAAAYLLSPESRWVTGQILAVDGGMSSIR